MAILARSSALRAVKAAAPAGRSLRRVVRVHAEAEKPEGTIHYGGNTYSPAEWEAAKASGNLPAAEPVPVAAAAAGVPTFGSLMAFSGPAPEVINGRLAMLGVVAAIAAELVSGESVLKQITEEPTGIVAAFALFIAASFAPLLSNKAPSSQSIGPFNAKAEMINGRAAMLGFAALLAIELVKGSPLF